MLPRPSLQLATKKSISEWEGYQLPVLGQNKFFLLIESLREVPRVGRDGRKSWEDELDVHESAGDEDEDEIDEDDEEDDEDEDC